MSLSYLCLVLVNVTLGVVGQTLIKLGVNKIGGFEIAEARNFFFTAFTDPLVLGGIFLYGLSTLLWLVLLSKIDLSVVYPMLSLGYVFILIISASIFHETISLGNIAGVLLICGGVILVAK